MADANAKGAGRDWSVYVAFIFIIVALVVLVWLAREAANGLPQDLAHLHNDVQKQNNNDISARTQSPLSTSGPNQESNVVTPQSDWLSYRDRTFGYTLSFPPHYQARLLDSREFGGAMPGESILSGVVISAPGAYIQAPNYKEPTLTLLVTDWPGFGSAQNFINQTYTQGVVPQNQIRQITVSGRTSLSLDTTSNLGGVSTTHTEIVVPGAGTRIYKIIYWPSDNATFTAIAQTLSLNLNL